MKKFLSFILCLTILMGTMTCLGFSASAEDKADPGYYETAQPADDTVGTAKAGDPGLSDAEMQELAQQVRSLPSETADADLAPTGADVDTALTGANIDDMFYAHVTSYLGGAYLSYDPDDNDNVIVEERNNNTRYQLWLFVQLDNGAFVILNVDAGMLLEVAGSTAENHANIWLNGIGNTITLNQQWHIYKLGDYYKFVSALDENYCIERAGTNTNDVELYTDSNSQYCVFDIKEIPVAVSATAVSNGVKVKWESSYTNAIYRVFRQEYPFTNWKKIADTTAYSYTDTTAKTNTVYYYTVRCVNSYGAYQSDYDGFGVRIWYRKNPVVQKVFSFSGNMRVVWSGTIDEDSQVYRVFRKAGSGSWQALGDTTDTSCGDYDVSYGTKYTYTVRVYDTMEGDYASYFDTTGKSLKYYGQYYTMTPSVTSAAGSATGVLVKWSDVAMSDDTIRVFRKTGSSGWKKLVDLAGTKTSYTDKSAKSGTKYAYTVRVMYNGSYVSNYDTAGKSLTYYAAPKISSLRNTSSGVKIVWTKTAGVPKYRVFRQTYNASTGKWSSWQKVGDTSNTSGLDTNVKKKVKYRYTVRCMNKAKTKYISGFDSVGKTITFK